MDHFWLRRLIRKPSATQKHVITFVGVLSYCYTIPLQYELFIMNDHFLHPMLTWSPLTLMENRYCFTRIPYCYIDTQQNGRSLKGISFRSFCPPTILLVLDRGPSFLKTNTMDIHSPVLQIVVDYTDGIRPFSC